MLPDVSVFAHFHFLRPAFALLALVWIALTIAQNRRHTQRDMFGGIIAPHLLEHLRVQRFDTRLFNPRSFGAVFTLLALLVLMGPSWRQQPSPLNQDEAALVVLLDVSASMEQQDVQPSRLERAKQKISDLLALRPDKKAALIVYAGSAHSVLPLTADQQILNQYLAAITPRIMPRTGKFPEYALPLVDAVLRETNAPATVVLFTDATGADSAQSFATYFTAHAHQLLVVGVGTAQPTQGLAPLDSESLEDLADDANGRYITLTVDAADVREVSRRTDSYYVVADENALPWLDSGYALIFPAMALFLMWFRKGWTLTWSSIVLVAILHAQTQPAYAQAIPDAVATQHEGADKDKSSTQSDYAGAATRWFVDLWLTSDQQGRLLMALGHYPQAAARFTDPMWKAMAYYYAEEFMLAAEYFSRRDADEALFNEANARAHARDYVRAIGRYNRLLARTPQFPGAIENRARVQDIVEQINRLSENQQPEGVPGSDNNQLHSEDAIPAQGAAEIVWKNAELKQLTAEQILQDPATSDMWLRGVQQDPANFLAIKFNMQLRAAEASLEQSNDL